MSECASRHCLPRGFLATQARINMNMVGFIFDSSAKLENPF